MFAVWLKAPQAVEAAGEVELARLATSPATLRCARRWSATTRSMRCVDVNVLVYAHRLESPDHDRYATWLDEARAGDEPLGLSDMVLSGFLRVVTHPRVFKEPTPLASALEFVDALRAAPMP